MKKSRPGNFPEGRPLDTSFTDNVVKKAPVPVPRTRTPAGADAEDIRRIINRVSHDTHRQSRPAAPHPSSALRRRVKPRGLRQRMAVFLRNWQRRKAHQRVSPAMRTVKKILTVLLILVLTVGGISYIGMNYLLGLVQRPTETTVRTGGGTTQPAATTLPLTNPVPEIKGITNILLLGIDNRILTDSDDDSNSDVMIVVTIDADNKVVKLTSFQRDMIVYVPGVEVPIKLTEAHRFGGAAMTMRTINENFRLNLTDYVEVNIFESERLIDIVGGINLYIAEDILWHTNQCINMQNIFFPDSEEAQFLTSGGLQHLNGRQAVGYARVRAFDSDYKRMGRQREVLQAVFNAFLEASLGSKLKMVTEGLGTIYTSLDNDEITKLALKVAPAMGNQIQQKQVPDPVKWGVEFIEDTTFKIRVDFNGVIPILHQFMYNKSFIFDPVRVIPGAPNSKLPLPSGVYIFDGTPTPVSQTTAAPTTAAPTTAAPTTAAPTTAAPTTAAPTTAAPTTAAPTTAVPTTAAPTTAAPTTAAPTTAAPTTAAPTTAAPTTAAPTTAAPTP